MAEVDRDLEAIITFCRLFEEKYLSGIEERAQILKQESANTTTTLGNTKMSTKASEKLSAGAEKLLQAVNQGEVRIREIERQAKEQLDELNRIIER